MKKVKYFHATKLENWENIRREGLHPGIDDCVHLTTDKSKAVQYVATYNPVQIDVAVLEVKVNAQDIKPHYDGLASGDDHFIHEGRIKPELLSMQGIFTVKPSKRKADGDIDAEQRA